MGNTKKAKSNTTKVWTIKGVENETRAKVSKAAKRAGMTIGAYVNKALLEIATRDLKGKSAPPAKLEDLETKLQSQFLEVHEAIAKIARKMDEKPDTLWSRLFKSKGKI